MINKQVLFNSGAALATAQQKTYPLLQEWFSYLGLGRIHACNKGRAQYPCHSILTPLVPTNRVFVSVLFLLVLHSRRHNSIHLSRMYFRDKCADYLERPVRGFVEMVVKPSCDKRRVRRRKWGLHPQPLLEEFEAYNIRTSIVLYSGSVVSRRYFFHIMHNITLTVLKN